MPASSTSSSTSGGAVLLNSRSPFQFIPHFHDTLWLLADINGLAGIISAISRDRDQRIPVDPKTLRRLSSPVAQPLRPSSLEKISRFLRDVVPLKVSDDEIAQIYAPWEKLGISSNGLSWFVSVLVPIQREAPERLEMRSLRFLRMRINQEFKLLSKQQLLMGGLQKRDPSLKVLWKAFLRNKTSISTRRLKQSLDIVMSANHRGAPTHTAAAAAQRLSLYLQVDFFYSLLACLEYDLRPVMHEGGLGSRELFGEMVPPHEQGKYREPIDVVLDKWRQDFAEDPNKPLTWIELAENLKPSFGLEPENRPDFSNSEDARQFLREIKKHRLTDWRKGNKRPQKEQLDAFVRSLVPAGQNDWWAALRLYWANMLGKLIQAEKKRNEDSGFLLEEIEITRAFCDFDQYLSKFGKVSTDKGWDAEKGPADWPARLNQSPK